MSDMFYICADEAIGKQICFNLIKLILNALELAESIDQI